MKYSAVILAYSAVNTKHSGHIILVQRGGITHYQVGGTLLKLKACVTAQM